MPVRPWAQPTVARRCRDGGGYYVLSVRVSFICDSASLAWYALVCVFEATGSCTCCIRLEMRCCWVRRGGRRIEVDMRYRRCVVLLLIALAGRRSCTILLHVYVRMNGSRRMTEAEHEDGSALCPPLNDSL